MPHQKRDNVAGGSFAPLLTIFLLAAMVLIQTVHEIIRHRGAPAAEPHTAAVIAE